jgi:PAS domain S-box-containing protein
MPKQHSVAPPQVLFRSLGRSRTGRLFPGGFVVDHLFDLFVKTTEDYGIIMLDTDGIVRRWNRGAERLFGYTAAEVEGSPGHIIFVPPDQRAGVPELELRTAAEQGRAEDERWHLRKDGSRVWVSGLMISLREHGVLQGYVKVVRDFTERLHLEEAVRQSQKLESVGVLAAGVAHDFNNVLTAIIGNLSLARRALPGASTEKIDELLAAAERAGQRAAELVRQLLNYAGKGRREIRSVDVCRVAHDTIAIVRASVPPKIALRLDVPDRCPPLQADVGQVQQLLLNLVLNAAEAIGDGPGKVDIQVRIRKVATAELRQSYPGFALAARPYTEIKVRDNGKGMDPDTLRQIFDPFFTTKFLGRGLGLAAALGVVRAHGGGIAVDSALGTGTTFTVLLPVEQEMEEPKTVADAVTDAARGEGMVLVVDDEPAIRVLVQRTLEDLGYTVVVAEHGGQAVEMFDRVADEVVLVLLDLAMPILDGADTAVALHTRRSDVPLVVMSGMADEEALARFGKVRIAGFVPKPFSPDQLAQAIAVGLRMQVNHAASEK